MNENILRQKLSTYGFLVQTFNKTWFMAIALIGITLILLASLFFTKANGLDSAYVSSNLPETKQVITATDSGIASAAIILPATTTLEIDEGDQMRYESKTTVVDGQASTQKSLTVNGVQQRVNEGAEAEAEESNGTTKLDVSINSKSSASGEGGFSSSMTSGFSSTRSSSSSSVSSQTTSWSHVSN